LFITFNIAHPSEVGIIIFTCILIAFSVVCAIYVMATWQNKVTKAASPPFLLIVIVGSIFVYSGVLTRPLQTTASMCLATPWLLVGGFVLMYSSIFSRTYRLLRIFNNRSLEIFKVPDFHLYVIVGVLVAIASILLILWTAIVPQQAVLITPDLTRPIQNYYKCASPEGTTVFFGLVGAYMFGIIVAGGVMAIMIWNIRYEVYNESKQLGFAIYNLLFFFVLAIVVSSVFDEDQREISFVLRSVCINLGTCITIGALFIPKMVIAAGGMCSYLQLIVLPSR
jgi:gamma-aminobutyric acid type B receptor